MAEVRCDKRGLDDDVPRAQAAKRRRIPAKDCSGDGEMAGCVFSIYNPGGPAKALPGSNHCSFCAPDFSRNMEIQKKKDEITKLLRKLDQEQQKLVDDKLPGKQKMGEARSRKTPEIWEDVLTHRRRAHGFDDEEAEKAAYRKQVLDDRRRAAVKMKFEKPKHPANAPVENDSGLPPAGISERAKDFERWCVEG